MTPRCAVRDHVHAQQAGGVFVASESGAVATELARAAPVLVGAFLLNTALPTLGTEPPRCLRRSHLPMTKPCRASLSDRGQVAAVTGPKLYPRSHYVHELRSTLSAAVFAPARGRLLRVPLHAAIAIATIAVIARGWLPWPLVPFASLAIGINFACLTFVAHEALHGGITRTRWLQRVTN